MENERLTAIVRRRDPATLPPGATVQDACMLMRDHGVSAILVVADDGGLLGIFTGRDAVCRVLAEGRGGDEMRLADVMTPKPATLPASETAIAALRVMSDCGVRHLPIVDDGCVVGIVSRGDLRALQHARLDLETRFFEVLR